MYLSFAYFSVVTHRSFTLRKVFTDVPVMDAIILFYF